MRRTLLGLAVITTTLLGQPAWADMDEPCRGEGSCSQERETTINFHDSPVQTGDIVVCTPGATCHFGSQPQESPS